jgi:aconitate hydratase
MGVLPLQFMAGASMASLGLSGTETFDIGGVKRALEGDFSAGMRVQVSAKATDGKVTKFDALLRIDTPNEAEYYRHGGILQYVLRRLIG